ncbi:unnamed protein product, partial [Rotaria socialis]
MISVQNISQEPFRSSNWTDQKLKCCNGRFLPSTPAKIL